MWGEGGGARGALRARGRGGIRLLCAPPIALDHMYRLVCRLAPPLHPSAPLCAPHSPSDFTNLQETLLVRPRTRPRLRLALSDQSIPARQPNAQLRCRRQGFVRGGAFSACDSPCVVARLSSLACTLCLHQQPRPPGLRPDQSTQPAACLVCCPRPPPGLCRERDAYRAQQAGGPHAPAARHGVRGQAPPRRAAC